MKMGFVPGETMVAYIDASNQSNRRLKRLEIKVHPSFPSSFT